MFNSAIENTTCYFRQRSYQELFAAFLCMTLALALQAQFKLFQSETYLGLRVNLGDFILPFAGLFIGLSLLLKKSAWPAWQKPFKTLWPVIMSAAIGLSLVYGYHLYGSWNRWALVNKAFGWCILMAYFYAGAWVATNFSTKTVMVFIRSLIIGFLVITYAYAASQILDGYGISFLPINHYKMEGFLGNRNAFAFLFMSVSTLITAFFMHKTSPGNSKTLWALWFIFPACLFLNGSRTLWLAFFCFCLYMPKLGWKNLRNYVLAPALLGLIAFFLVSGPIKNSIMYKHLRASSNFYSYTKNIFSDTQEEAEINLNSGDDMRLKVTKAAFDAWKERPLLGNGLGGGLETQKEKFGKAHIVIHNTLLWIATDMGLAGVLVFISSFIAMLMALARTVKDKSADINRHALAHASFAILLIFGGFSMFHEILYTRFMWFVLGLALAVPLAQKPDSAQS